jgi:hypothetical protein
MLVHQDGLFVNLVKGSHLFQWYEITPTKYVQFGVADLGVGVLTALDLVFFQKGFHCTIEGDIIFSSILLRMNITVIQIFIRR